MTSKKITLSGVSSIKVLPSLNNQPSEKGIGLTPSTKNMSIK